MNHGPSYDDSSCPSRAVLLPTRGHISGKTSSWFSQLTFTRTKLLEWRLDNSSLKGTPPRALSCGEIQHQFGWQRMFWDSCWIFGSREQSSLPCIMTWIFNCLSFGKLNISLNCLQRKAEKRGSSLMPSYHRTNTRRDAKELSPHKSTQTESLQRFDLFCHGWHFESYPSIQNCVIGRGIKARTPLSYSEVTTILFIAKSFGFIGITDSLEGLIVTFIRIGHWGLTFQCRNLLSPETTKFGCFTFATSLKTILPLTHPTTEMYMLDFILRLPSSMQWGFVDPQSNQQIPPVCTRFHCVNQSVIGIFPLNSQISPMEALAFLISRSSVINFVAKSAFVHRNEFRVNMALFFGRNLIHIALNSIWKAEWDSLVSSQFLSSASVLRESTAAHYCVTSTKKALYGEEVSLFSTGSARARPNQSSAVWPGCMGQIFLQAIYTQSTFRSKRLRRDHCCWRLLWIVIYALHPRFHICSCRGAMIFSCVLPSRNSSSSKHESHCWLLRWFNCQVHLQSNVPSVSKEQLRCALRDFRTSHHLSLSLEGFHILNQELQGSWGTKPTLMHASAFVLLSLFSNEQRTDGVVLRVLFLHPSGSLLFSWQGHSVFEQDFSYDGLRSFVMTVCTKKFGHRCRGAAISIQPVESRKLRVKRAQHLWRNLRLPARRSLATRAVRDDSGFFPGRMNPITAPIYLCQKMYLAVWSSLTFPHMSCMARRTFLWSPCASVNLRRENVSWKTCPEQRPVAASEKNGS